MDPTNLSTYKYTTHTKGDNFEAYPINQKTYTSKHGKTHDAVEHWLGKHNRKFEMLRTITSSISASASSIVLLKVFGLV